MSKLIERIVGRMTRNPETTVEHYPLKIFGTQNIWLPEGSEILGLDQEDDSSVWLLVQQPVGASASTNYTIDMYGTGLTIDGADRWYIGSVRVNHLTYHVFERT